jgi:glutamate formiminotransferase/glutamate formiminotransferase/formiminotetrahydrofolate cyclodeaminase
MLTVPNVSEGRDERTIAAVGAAFAWSDDAGGPESLAPGPGLAAVADEAASDSAPVRVLDVHRDSDHHRSVFTLAGSPAALVEALIRGARVALERIDVIGSESATGPGAPHGENARRGEHPYVGALDVAPLVYLDAPARGLACAHALVVADRIGEELDIPVFLYGELSGGRTRAELRRGGLVRLSERIEAGELRPDFGPARLHPTAGATLVAVREPLVAFNLRLASPATVKDARAIAALIREGGAEGLAGVRAIGVALSGEVAQVSTNVERPLEVPLARVIEAVRQHADVIDAELVGLAPRVALEGFPEDVPLPGFDPARHTIENALGL